MFERCRQIWHYRRRIRRAQAAKRGQIVFLLLTQGRSAAKSVGDTLGDAEAPTLFRTIAITRIYRSKSVSKLCFSARLEWLSTAGQVMRRSLVRRAPLNITGACLSNRFNGERYIKSRLPCW